MKAIPLEIPEVIVLTPRAFSDERGEFFESYSSVTFNDATGVNRNFVQDNHSVSAKGVLRGLHFQMPPRAQGKLVRVVEGAIFDVAVDLRRSSPTFGHWVYRVLSASNREQLWIPEGFGHGFQVITDNTQVLYKTTDHYAPETEKTIIWNDPDLGIDWPDKDAALISHKDMRGIAFAQMPDVF